MCVPQVVADAWSNHTSHTPDWYRCDRPFDERELEVVASLVADGWALADAADAAAALHP